MISWGTYPLGAVLGGWIAEAIGLRAPSIICGALPAGTSFVVGTMTSNRIVEVRLAEAAQLREASAADA